MGSRWQLGVDEELALDQLGHQFTTQLRNKDKAANQDNKGNCHRDDRTLENATEQPGIGFGQGVESLMEELERHGEHGTYGAT